MVKPLIVGRIVKIEDADDDWDIKFWQKAGVNARFSATWGMIKDFYKIKGIKNGNKRRLQRSIQNIEQI